MSTSFLENKRLRTYFPHLFVIAILCFIPYFFVDDDFPRRTQSFFYRYYFQLGFLLTAFYVNYFILIPKLLLKNKKGYYLLCTLLLAIVLVLLHDASFHYTMHELFPYKLDRMEQNFDPKRAHHFFGFEIMLEELVFLLLGIGFSTGIRLISEWAKAQSKAKDQEKRQVEAELTMLRNQVSPHFFFNTLNNIYALIEISQEEAQHAVEKLSNLMRYLIYDTNIKDTPLHKELEFMESYIALMQLRVSDSVKINVSFPKNNTQLTIPPLLFIPFIENAFKHGVSYNSSSYISISLSEKDGFLIFDIENSIPPNTNSSKKNKKGIGLDNVRKRIALLYTNSADFQLIEENNHFKVHLSLPIKK